MSAGEYGARGLAGPPRSRTDLRTRSIPVETWALGVLILLAVVIRILTIDNQSFWADEALTAYEAQLPLGAMIHTVVHVETTPPLYFLLTWGWAHVFGTSAVALRSISTLSGIALVPIAYLCGRELFSSRTGVLAAAFVAVNPFMIWYSQEARAYMLLAALTGGAFLWFVRAHQQPSRRNLAWWAALSSLSLMTHFFAGFAIAPEALLLLWKWRSRPVSAAVGVVGAVQVAMAPFALIDSSHGVGWIAGVPKANRVGKAALEWGVSLLYRRATIAEGLIGAGALLVIVAGLIVFAGDRSTRTGGGIAAILAGSAFLLPLALGYLGPDYFLSRNLIAAFVPLSTLVAAACLAPRARVLGGLLALGLLAMFSVAALQVQTHPYLERADWRKVARALGATRVPRAILAADGTTADPLKIYLPGVDWTQPHRDLVLIKEVDVVGATKRLVVVPTRRLRAAASRASVAGRQDLRRGQRRPVGFPLPVTVNPPGARLISRFRVGNWILARFMLAHPLRTSIDRLLVIAPRFFRRTPQALMVFMQRPGH
ncbi:MAG: glycosyltransferase family 39 protein [Solirubrobacteraceae bacterium]